jgi:hypothetical protein
MPNGTRHLVAPRLFLRVLALLLPVLVVLLVPARAEAYSWMIRHSYTGCAVCHADPSGGETLTPYGRAQSDLLLRMRYDGKKAEEAEPSSTAGFLGFADLPPALMLGGSLRVASTAGGGSSLRVFPMQLDAHGQVRIDTFFFGGSLGAAKVPAASLHARPAQLTTEQGDGYNLISRNFYIGMDFAESKYTARVGRLNLPFGVRIPEHTLWVREATRTDRESDQQWGAALAYNSEDVRAEIMGIAGNYQINPDEFRERGYSFYVELVLASRATLGVSSLYTLAGRDRWSLETNVARGAHGLFTRMALADPLAVLAEFDLITDSTKSLGYTGFLQADYELVQGLHGMLTFETLDAGYPKATEIEGLPRTPGAGRAQFGGWLSAVWFFLPHLDMRVDGILRPDGFTIFSQLHAFL